ncbi:thermonuclease family protein [Viridibacillus arvi]|uniref:thermonuclease family protein n=1 Tax=Viridibacillus arvi TaxID=263475 RepID=UPI0034CDE3C3
MSASLLSLALLLTGCSSSGNGSWEDTFQADLSGLEEVLPYSTGENVTKDNERKEEVEKVKTEFWPQSATFKMKKSTVTKILDGDLIVISGGEKIKLLGITTEENRGNGRIYHYIPKEKTVAFLNKTILNKTIYIEQNPVYPKNEKGESLAYVWIGNAEKLKNVNAILLKNGLALTERMDPVSVYDKTFKSIENEAQTNQFGLWKIN